MRQENKRKGIMLLNNKMEEILTVKTSDLKYQTGYWNW